MRKNMTFGIIVAIIGAALLLAIVLIGINEVAGSKPRDANPKAALPSDSPVPISVGHSEIFEFYYLKDKHIDNAGILRLSEYNSASVVASAIKDAVMFLSGRDHVFSGEIHNMLNSKNTDNISVEIILGRNVFLILIKDTETNGGFVIRANTYVSKGSIEKVALSNSLFTDVQTYQKKVENIQKYFSVSGHSLIKEYIK